MVCPGPKDWTEYVNEFKTHASNISGKRAEELFGFHESSAQVVQYERQLTIAAKELEETEFKLREAREKAAEEIKIEKAKLIQDAEQELALQLGNLRMEI